MSTAVGFSGLQGIHQILISTDVAQLSIKSYLLFLLNITYIGYSGYYWKIIMLSVSPRTEIYHRVYLNRKSYNWVISKIELSLFSFKNMDICQKNPHSNETKVMRVLNSYWSIFFSRLTFNTTPRCLNTFQIFRTRSENKLMKHFKSPLNLCIFLSNFGLECSQRF